MPNRLLEYLRAASLSEARSALARPDVSTQPLMLGPRVPDAPYAGAEAVVDLSGLGLSYIREDSAGIRLGALTPLQDLLDSDLLKNHAGGLLALAAHLAAPSTLRNLATVGGAWQASEGPPEIRLALLVLDAAPAEAGPLSELVLPRAPEAGLGSAIERVGRTPRDAAIVAAAARLTAEAGVGRGVRIAVAGESAQPRRLPAVEEMLEGKALTPESLLAAAQRARDEAQPIGDFRGSADYRREMAGVLVRRAVERAWARAAG